jgi:hypothetical protein
LLCTRIERRWFRRTKKKKKILEKELRKNWQKEELAERIGHFSALKRSEPPTRPISVIASLSGIYAAFGAFRDSRERQIRRYQVLRRNFYVAQQNAAPHGIA